MLVEEKPKRKPAPHFELIEFFFELKKWPMNYLIAKRFLRPAMEIYKAANLNIPFAKEKIRTLALWADSKKLDWSLETVLKRWLADNSIVEEPKKAYIDGDPAIQDPITKRWRVKIHTGQWVDYVGNVQENLIWK